MTWIIFLFIGIASAIALNPDYVADKVIAGMNTQLAAHGSQWFSLPGFEISFNNRNESKWKFVNGELTSIGNVDRDPEQVGPEIVYFSSDRGWPSVVININIANVAVTYNFICEDFFVISGFTYAITRTVPTQATLLVDVSDCRGTVRSATSSFSYEEDGSDFSKITPFDQYAKQCIIRSYTTVGDYADRINSQFQKDYGPAVEKMLSTALENTLNNLNLCAQ